MKLFDVLETVEWGMVHFGSVCSNSQLPLRDIKRAIEARLVRCIGDVPLCDGDGYALVPERYSKGYVLTRIGKSTLKRMRDLANQNKETEEV